MTMKTQRWFVAGVVVAALVSACGDSDGGASGGEDTSAQDTGDATDIEGDMVAADAVADTASDSGVAPDIDAVQGGDAVADTGPGGDGWSTLPSVPGGVVQENAVVAHDGRVYVLGGMRNLFGIVADVHRFDPVVGTWETVQALPSAVHHPNAATVDGGIVVIGALETFSFSATAVAWRYDSAANRWDNLTPMPSERRRGASAVAVVGTDVYLVGGYRGGAVAEVDVYDAAIDTWTALADYPMAADHFVAETVDGVIYAIGGRDTAGSLADVDAEVWALDTASDAGWQARAPMPTARAGMMSGVVGGQIYVVGGEGNREPGTDGVFPQVEVYDPAADRWSTLPDMRTPRHGTGAVGLDGVLYVPAGADVEAFGAVDVFEAYTP